MPRSNRYFVPQRTYHLTHRCHNQQFLFRFAKDRNLYLHLIRESLKEHNAWLLDYCLTKNHVHFLARSESNTGISDWLQHVQGWMAIRYNLRKNRSGAFWSGRFHSTMIEDGIHLLRCMVYIELNMVRAGAVKHPKDWAWNSYQEWFGHKKRKSLIDIERTLSLMGGIGLKDFIAYFGSEIERKLAQGNLQREPIWTNPIAIGSPSFLKEFQPLIQWRNRTDLLAHSEETWSLHESPGEYKVHPGSKFMSPGDSESGDVSESDATPMLYLPY